MMKAIDSAFANTTRFLFGKPLSPLADYEKWLQSRIAGGKTVKSAIGSGETYVPDYAFMKRIPHGRIVSIENEKEASGRRLDEKDCESVEGITRSLGKAAYFVPDFVEGKNADVVDTPVHWDCLNVFRSFDIFTTKNSAYIFSTINSEHLFGCYRIMNSKFLVHCYNSANLTACFEMDNAKSCSGSMFCHNVENVHDSMFCFNVKSMRYAVGNVEVGKERFLEIKKQVMDEIAGKLEREKKLDVDIYNALK